MAFATRWDHPWNFPVRAAQLAFAIIVLGLTAYAVDAGVRSDTVNFVLFDGVWTLLVTFFLILAPPYFPDAVHQSGILVAEALTMIFWFAGFIALAVWLPPARFCHGDVCSSLQAATVFGSFEWALFALTTSVFLYGFRGGQKPPAAHPTANIGV